MSQRVFPILEYLRIIELFRLEKNFKITKSHNPALPSPPLNHTPKNLIYMSLKPLQGW